MPTDTELRFIARDLVSLMFQDAWYKAMLYLMDNGYPNNENTEEIARQVVGIITRGYQRAIEANTSQGE